MVIKQIYDEKTVNKVKEILTPIEGLSEYINFRKRDMELMRRTPLSDEKIETQFRNKQTKHFEILMTESFVTTRIHESLGKNEVILEKVNRIKKYLLENKQAIPLNPLFYPNKEEFEEAIIKRLLNDLIEYSIFKAYNGLDYHERLIKEGIISELIHRGVLQYENGVLDRNVDFKTKKYKAYYEDLRQHAIENF